MKLFATFLLSLSLAGASAQVSQQVNTFLGSSGDHGQMSPAASYPFSMLSIGPQTYPKLHMGYEHKAKVFKGFTHNRFEGVGCQGSGGNILIQPFVNDPASCTLHKVTEAASAGYYQVAFANGIKAAMAVAKNTGAESYHFPAAGKKGFVIDLSHTLANKFVAEQHEVAANGITGWIDSRTTCNVGTYRVYYALQFSTSVKFEALNEHQLLAMVNADDVQLNIAFSSVDVAHAKAPLNGRTFEEIKGDSQKGWNDVLGRITVKGDAEREKLFYSLLYRTVQSPYLVSEPDGSYRATDGTLQKTKGQIYNGWAIWDNYRTQLPLLAILYPERYQYMMNSLVEMYKHGKKDYATQHEPSNTVRTEHAIVVLLDAYRKGFKVDLASIADSLTAEVERLDFKTPDKTLESSYDTWALSQIMNILHQPEKANKYLQKAEKYKEYWNKDFKDLTKADVDRVSARGMYQGTIWQYRWLVPFDNKGLVELIGGEQAYLKELDYFFDNDLYTHANEPDIQAPLMYNFTSQPWRSQAMVHKYAVDTVVQYYFNDNSRGIDPFIEVIYQNKPDTYQRTMDDDAGAMSGWFIFAGTGLFPACSGWPVYYLSVPLFKEVQLNRNEKPFTIKVNNYTPDARYITSATLNGRPLERNWLTHDEVMKGGTLVITASTKPDPTWGTRNQWISSINMK